MEYSRHSPKQPRTPAIAGSIAYTAELASRPLGMGAFFDYALAVTRLCATQRAGPWWKKKSLPARHPHHSAEERWDDEGGNSQTRIARRAARYER
jgi:hypothetical protein